jgi:hypothetical protein
MYFKPEEKNNSKPTLPRLQYPEKVVFIIEGEIKTYCNF